MKKKKFFPITKLNFLLYSCLFSLLTACGQTPSPSTAESPLLSTENTTEENSAEEIIAEEPIPSAKPEESKGTRDNTPVCLIPSTPGSTLYSNEFVALDASNSSEGYVCVNYTGSCSKVKLQITGPNGVTYTYNLTGNIYETFPLTCGDGGYSIGVFENISGNTYSTTFYQDLNVTLSSEFTPFLYPSQYVNFTPESETVAKAQELAASADTDLDVVSNVYNYVISSVTYDYDKASNIASGYISSVNEQ